ncbi:PCRF domain-containing protein, partial [Corynebacterium sanguinis]
MQPETQARIQNLDSTLTTIEKVMDLDELAARARELEQQANDPSLWDDPAHAQKVTTELSNVQARLKKVASLRERIDDLPVMYELAEEEGEPALVDDELSALEESIGSLEVQTMLSGEYDEREAVVNIRSGAGGVDAADWAEMLMRMYTRWAEKNGYKVEVYDISYAEEAGIKSA